MKLTHVLKRTSLSTTTKETSQLSIKKMFCFFIFLKKIDVY